MVTMQSNEETLKRMQKNEQRLRNILETFNYGNIKCHGSSKRRGKGKWVENNSKK